MSKPTVGWWVAVGALVVGLAVLPIAGQQTSGGPDVLNALLVEVRGLRAAIEQMSSAGAQVQLAMGRLQLQEQRINTMLRRLDSVREQKAAAEREGTSLGDEIAGADERSERAEDLAQRKLAAAQSRALRNMLERRSADLQRLTAEEAEVANAIAAEQSRWSDINRTLEELERALTRR
jgi:DNA repair exonuclease SbcCD ATPase subunit